MKQFSREVIKEEERKYYELISTKSRKEWIDLYLNEVRPHYTTMFWKHREKISDETMPVHGKRLIVKARDGYDLPMIIYRPDGTEGIKLPTYFQIHGGGWVMGVPEINDAECCRYRDEAGCQVINLGYRLAPEWEFPYGLYDCYDGVQYFINNAEQYGIDVNQLGIGGESAGASLAIGMCFLANDRKEFQFKMQLLSYPNVNLGYVAEDCMIGKEDPGWIQNFYTTSPLCYTDPSQLRNPVISPLFATDATLAKLPTTVLLTCDADMLRPQAEDWAMRCVQNGVMVIEKCFEHTWHAFTLKDPTTWIEDLCKPGVDFLVEGLKNYLMK